jgi:murein DD-endopeptidase MepM/ murein hydrolase activator NlpD
LPSGPLNNQILASWTWKHLFTFYFLSFVFRVSTAQPDIDLSKRNELKEWQQKWQSEQQSIWDRQKGELEQHRQNGLSQLQIEPVATQTQAQTESEEIEDYEILNQFFQTPIQKQQQAEVAEPASTSGWQEVTTGFGPALEISFDSNSAESVSEKPRYVFLAQPF